MIGYHADVGRKVDSLKDWGPSRTASIDYDTMKLAFVARHRPVTGSIMQGRIGALAMPA